MWKRNFIKLTNNSIMTKKEKRQAFIMEIKNIIDPLILKLEMIDSKISKGKP